MPPTSPQEFEDDTAFERYALNLTFPLIMPSQGSTVIDLRGQEPSVSVSVRPGVAEGATSVGVSGRRIPLKDWRPLLFLAAWKVLDFLIEYALYQSGRRDPSYSFKIKVNACSAGLKAPHNFSGHNDIWKALTSLYVGIVDLRHTYVHRHLPVGDDGALYAEDNNRQQTGKPFTFVQQESMCRVAQRAADAVITGSMDRRAAGDLAYHLDVLRAHHKGKPLNGVEAPLRNFVVQIARHPDETGQVALDIDAIRKAASEQTSDATYFDLEVYLPDRVLKGRLEDADAGCVRFRPDSSPDWLTS
jgi:hypothetical protein